MKKAFLLVLVAFVALGCSKDSVDNTITQKELLPAPDWLIGTWESEDKTEELTVKENGQVYYSEVNIRLVPVNFEKKYYKDNNIFYFIYDPTDGIRDKNSFGRSNLFTKWEFKKLSDTKISVGNYACDKNGNRLKAGKYGNITITNKNSTPTIYTKVK